MTVANQEKNLGKVLVTGAAGYVGCVLTPRLLEAGYEVTVYDIMFYGRENLPDHPKQISFMQRGQYVWPCLSAVGPVRSVAAYT